MSKKKKSEISIRSSAAEYLTFVAAGGGSEASVEMRYEDENVWLTQKLMATLYDVSVPAINQHLKRIFSDSELEESSVVKQYLIAAADGKNYLTNWQDAPHGKIQKFDVSIAKNYLTDTELAQLQRLVNAYLDIAEDMAQRMIPMTMADWEERLNRFIAATDRAILQDAGKVTTEIAKAHAESEFETYRIVQDRLYLSDFDKKILALTAPETAAAPQDQPATDNSKLTVQIRAKKENRKKGDKHE